MTQSDAPQAEQTEPQNKAELLARIRSARASLEGTLAGADDEALSAPGPEGWAVKDHLAHLAAWGRKVLGNMDGLKSTEVLGLTDEVFQSGDWVAINEVVRAPDKDKSAAEIVAEYRRVHAALLQRIEATLEGELYGPDDKLRSNIAGNTYGHDEEHRPWIETVLNHNR